MKDQEREILAIFKGVDLPDEVFTRIAGELKNIVIKEIAKIDTKGDLVVKDLPEQRAIRTFDAAGGGGNGTAGVEVKHGGHNE